MVTREDFAKGFECQKEGELLCVDIDGISVYGLFPYCSIFVTRMSNNASLTKYVNMVYGFKKFGRNAEMVYSSIERFRLMVGAEMVAAVPSHDCKPNRLQEKYGAIISRTVAVEKRKYNHNAEISKDGVVIDSSVVGKSVLLLDDICTTGKSMSGFRQMLLDAGAKEVHCLVVGMNITLLRNAEENGNESGIVEMPETKGEPSATVPAQEPKQLTLEEMIEECGANHFPLEQTFSVCGVTEEQFAESEEWQRLYRRGQLKTELDIRKSVIRMAKDGDAQSIKLYYERLRQEILPELNEVEDGEIS